MKNTPAKTLSTPTKTPSTPTKTPSTPLKKKTSVPSQSYIIDVNFYSKILIVANLRTFLAYNFQMPQNALAYK